MFPTTRVPVVLAPMAGAGTPALAAAVANGGGIGSFGFAYTHPSRIEADFRAARALTAGPLNANFFLFPPVAEPSAAELATASAALMRLEPGSSAVTQLQPPYCPDLAAQLDVVWRLRLELLTFHLGIPSSDVMLQARSLGIRVGITATRVEEARRITEAGADFIIAQGAEAGGHAGIFTAEDPEPWLPVLDLLRALRSATPLPLVAAGGLMNGADIRSVLDAGAVAAQLGTAFLTTDESAASPAHRRFLLGEPARGTVLTRGFTGRYARGIRNTFVDAMKNAETLPFPVQGALTTALRQAAAMRDDGEHQSLWAGTHYARCRTGSAVDLVHTLAAELARA